MATEILPIDQDGIKEVLKQRLIASGKYTDADFEGSNVSQLLDVMAYSAAMINTNSLKNIDEMILTKATERNHVIQDARLLGYEPKRRVSYQYNITIKPKNTGEQEIVNIDGTDYVRLYLKKYTKFESGDKFYWYLGDDTEYLFTEQEIIDDEPKTYINIVVKEGILYKYSDTENLNFTLVPEIVEGATCETETDSFINIDYKNIEDDGIELFATYVGEDNVQIIDEKWTKRKYFAIDTGVEIYKKTYLEMIDTNLGTLKLYSAYAGTGYTPKKGAIVKINLLESSGSSGEAAEIVSGNADFDANFYIEPALQSLRISGQEQESEESIKVNAPLFYNTANRAVTATDYKAITERENIVKYSRVWGGDEEVPVHLGYIWFSFLRQIVDEFTKTDFEYQRNDVDTLITTFLEDADVEAIFEDIRDFFKIITVQFKHRQPMYLDFDYNIDVVKYSTSEKDVIHERIFNVIRDYFLENIEVLDVEYFNSTILREIDTVVGNNSGVTLNLDSSVKLYKKQMIDEFDEKYFNVFLGLPFEDIFKEHEKDGVTKNIIDRSKLTSIYTENFIGTETLNIKTYTDDELYDLTLTNEPSVLEIVLGANVVGTYSICPENGYIAIELVIGNNLLESDFDEIRKININNNTPNYKVHKNTIIRLNKVQFEG